MKIIALVGFLLLVGGCKAIHPTAVQPFASHDQFILLDDLTYSVGNSNVVLTVPSGFVTDYASIPRGFWGIASPHDTYSDAAVVHDYLYWTQSCTRRQADNIFYIAMKEASVNPIRRWFIYRTVRMAGESSWDGNRKQFEQGLPRFVPPDSKLTADDRWPSFRQSLADKGVRDPETAKNPPYCAIGNNTDIPADFYRQGT
jgi:hypothetical protein